MNRYVLSYDAGSPRNLLDVELEPSLVAESRNRAAVTLLVYPSLEARFEPAV